VTIAIAATATTTGTTTATTMSNADVPAPEFDGSFALCLTHDVDRPYKTYQSLFYAATDRRLSHLESLLPGINPYWQFEEIMAIEERLGVRSAFYFLDAEYLLSRPVREQVRPFYWLERLGSYDVTAPAIARVIRQLDDGGWEVGLHGSYGTHQNTERLADEKRKLEAILGHKVQGGRQHYLRLSDPPTGTWTDYRSLGLSYDASLGSSTEYGFRHGYELVAPFDDRFRVFPLTLMEVALENTPGVGGDGGVDGGSHGDDTSRSGPGRAPQRPRRGSKRGIDVEAAWAECERLLAEAAANGAVMTVLWHPRYFNTEEFPGYRELYRQLIERALSRNAWVGPPGDLYATIPSEANPSPEEANANPGGANAGPDGGGPQ
jgi:peptidoglycan/xylan/chitin deacetylase (PgdA/CDA1 family)